MRKRARVGDPGHCSGSVMRIRYTVPTRITRRPSGGGTPRAWHAAGDARDGCRKGNPHRQPSAGTQRRPGEQAGCAGPLFRRTCSTSRASLSTAVVSARGTAGSEPGCPRCTRTRAGPDETQDPRSRRRPHIAQRGIRAGAAAPRRSSRRPTRDAHTQKLRALFRCRWGLWRARVLVVAIELIWLV